jgi:hypothetical protein
VLEEGEIDWKYVMKKFSRTVKKHKIPLTRKSGRFGNGHEFFRYVM